MNTRTRKTRLARGIYRDAHGISVVARIGSGASERTAPPVRFPLLAPDGREYSVKNRNLAELEQTFIRLREQLLRAPEAQRGAGTLAAEMDRYFDLLPPDKDGRHKKRDFAYLRKHWQASDLGAMDPDRIQPSDILKPWTDWQVAGVANTTMNHRIRILDEVLRWLHVNDKTYVPPTAKVHIKRLPPPDPEPRNVPIPTIRRIFVTMPDQGRAEKGQARPTVSRTKTILQVCAWTALPYAQLARLKKTDVDLRRARMLMPNRPKGKGVRAKYVPLLPQAVEAFKRFDAVGLWGLPHFSASSAWKSWTCAVENTRAALAREAAQTGDTQPLDDFNRDVPPKCHPYDLRHSFLTDAYEQTGDIRAVAGLGHHADIKTTERYTTGGVAKRETIAVDKMRDAWKDLPPVPPPAPRVPRPRGKLHLVPPRS